MEYGTLRTKKKNELNLTGRSRVEPIVTDRQDRKQLLVISIFEVLLRASLEPLSIICPIFSPFP